MSYPLETTLLSTHTHAHTHAHAHIYTMQTCSCRYTETHGNACRRFFQFAWKFQNETDKLLLVTAGVNFWIANM
uniref:Uncharacterized protein n=2 Tax=Anguilla anguilla TaxID=7936 RepID=A0A0E9R6G4_ANGAN